MQLHLIIWRQIVTFKKHIVMQLHLRKWRHIITLNKMETNNYT